MATLHEQAQQWFARASADATIIKRSRATCAPALHAPRFSFGVLHRPAHVANQHSAFILVRCGRNLLVEVWIVLCAVQDAEEGKARPPQELARIPACQLGATSQPCSKVL